MNERGRGNHEPSYQEHPGSVSTDNGLEARISRFLHKEAGKIHFTPALRHHIIRKISSQHPVRRNYVAVIVIVSAATLILTLSGLIYFMIHSAAQAGIHYNVSKVIAVAPELANGGLLLSLDPTERHIVYQPVSQSGVLYTADLINPIQSNTLAMRDARDMAWAPDGSALVATVAPANTVHPLLALVSERQYMRLLGHNNALAANWSPDNADEIMFAQQQNRKTQLWSIKTSGAPRTLRISLQEQLLIQHMGWSSDGRYLALVVTQNGGVTKETLDQPARAIYVMDFQTHKLTNLVAPGNFTIGRVAWSPTTYELAYEQIGTNQKIVLQTVNVTKPDKHTSIVPQHQLAGWSWSTDGRALVYSDGGKLTAYIFHGEPITFSHQKQFISPFWLKNGQILCMDITNGKGKLTLLTPQK
ncbi:WD40 repeat domain-containing protein [Dictyobacter formicarum]|uniref:Anaphase-promoting complex subunit 4 WD40 domain-containing protein n=1 Tax=Dictyobacter formicarum TaxID=2778368 RepID=A0ABQ3VED3_9CHLR|nr:WD40 repeat domain-containing protein [Dictyobacter formicarum]GHO84150.1 hypothetical protein KSZ_21560 [Dictyobacter formicarum]